MSKAIAYPTNLYILFELVTSQLFVVFSLLGQLMSCLFQLPFQVDHQSIIVRPVCQLRYLREVSMLTLGEQVVVPTP